MHNLILENRRKATLSGIKGTGNFDAQTVLFHTENTELLISGSGLRVTEINTETGNAVVEGEIRAVVYGDGGNRGGVPEFIGKIFKAETL